MAHFRFRRSFGNVGTRRFRGARPLGSTPALSAEAQNYFSRLDAAGDTTYVDYKQPLANYIDGLVSNSLWDGLETSALFVGVGFQGITVPPRADMPAITNNNFVGGDLNVLTGLTFDATSTYLSSAITAASFTATGSIEISLTPSVGSGMSLVSFSDTGTANNYIDIGINSDGLVYLEFNDGGTIHLVTSITAISDVASKITVTFDGSAYFIAINGEQEPVLDTVTIGNLGWFDDVTGGDTLCVGALSTSGGVSNYLDAVVSTYLVTSGELL